MSTLIGSDFVALHSQHTLQCADWLGVYALAKEEGINERLDSYGFDDFRCISRREKKNTIDMTILVNLVSHIRIVVHFFKFFR